MNIKWKFWEKSLQNNDVKTFSPSNSYFNNSIVEIFDGEKTPYELGSPSEVYLDYYALRLRSWDSFIKSDVIQNAIRKYILWIVGAGLRIQYEPVDSILLKDNINLTDDYIQDVEAQFRLYSNSKESSFSGQMNIHRLASEAFKNALLSGDVLIIMRFKNKKISCEIIDGVYIETPIGSGYEDAASKRGNYIKNGVEISKSGQHIAYYIWQEGNDYARVPAYGVKTKKRQAWLMYGMRNKITDTRGMTILTAVIENADKMDRFKEATLASAEENNNIPYTIEHNQFSDGENPMVKDLVQSLKKGKGTAPETDSFAACESYASKIALTTNKKVYNMPVGSTIKRNEFSLDPQFEKFLTINADYIYAVIGIPPEVALDKFGGSYSSSRASIKSWEYKMRVERINTLTEEFYKPIFTYWFDMNVFMQNIDAPGYLDILNQNNNIKREAYLNCRFIGKNVPHIDPLKEINAVRIKLGDKFRNVPLETLDQATEEIDSGDFNSIINKAKNEKDLSSDFIDDISDQGLLAD